MIRKYNDDTYCNGVRYECACDKCGNELEDQYYGNTSTMLCKDCFYSGDSEFIWDLHKVLEGEDVCCCECYNDIDVDDSIYKINDKKWVCIDCLEDIYKKNTEDAISDFNYWRNSEQ